MVQDIVTIATINFKPKAGDKANNQSRMLGYARAASKRGADIILFPELSLTGYDYYLDETISSEEKIASADTLDSETVAAFSDISSQYGTYIIYGGAEYCADKKKLYNSAFVTGPKGVIGAYRKIHPFADENRWFAKGENPFLFDTEWGPIGIGICYDSYQFPELMRYYTEKGIRLYLNPTALIEEINLKGSHESFRSYYSLIDYGVLCNTIYIASANLCGYDRTNYFAGGSCVIGPKITPFFETDVYCYGGDRDNVQETLDLTTIDLSLATRRLCQINPDSGEMDYRSDLYKKF